MLDWGVPDELDADNDLERYVDWYLPRAVAAVRRETGSDEVTLAGYCLGGVLAALYAAGHEDAPVRNLDPDGDAGRLRRDGRDGGARCARAGSTPRSSIDETGNVPADVLYSGFYMQAPTTEVAQKATLLENLWNDEFVEGFQAMAQWSRDHVPFPGAVFRELVEEFVRKNVLMTGSMRRRRPRDRPRDDARGNVLNAMAERDNVVPPRGGRAGHASWSATRTRREELRLPGGHVTFGTGRSRGQAHDAAPRRLDHRALRRTAPNRRSGDGDPTDRSPATSRRSSASSRASRRPTARSSRRTSTTPEVRRRVGAPGHARARSPSTDGEVVGSVAVVPLHGWSSHVGEVRLVVDPEQRGRGHRARRSRATRCSTRSSSGSRKLVVEVIADQTALIAMFRALGLRARGAARPTTCATGRARCAT